MNDNTTISTLKRQVGEQGREIDQLKAIMDKLIKLGSVATHSRKMHLLLHDYQQLSNKAKSSRESNLNQQIVDKTPPKKTTKANEHS